MSPPLSAYDSLLTRLNNKLFGNDSTQFLQADADEKGDEEVVSVTDKEVQQAILAGYYNAIMIYLAVANETLAAGGNLSDGFEMVRRISNRTFKGIAGNIHINSDGHRDTDMALVDMTDPWLGTFERVGVYSADTGQLNLIPGVKISWPGGEGPVEDIPECGFQDLLCATYGEGLGMLVHITSRYNQRMKQLTWWKIDMDELQPMKRNLTKSTFSSILRQEMLVNDTRFELDVLFQTSLISDIVRVSDDPRLDKLWVAPELLRSGEKGSQEGDVYSLAIIMSEIISREEPYSTDKEYLTTQGNKKFNKAGSLVDNLLQRLEKYSTNLEKIVDEKVDELRQEKHKSEELLRQMLPK
ncbi:atrial natriuretic peptide receptor 1-like [Aplysia californica]|uniref:Atrial natriuretic peptide receptor 1-like n=1 Tax=Aplysia californica TaxID=6500 RepID=A0ABM0K0P1_APLCA|nr:atrial natriuretic peptide receptor 1-like [Aplysia californica]